MPDRPRSTGLKGHVARALDGLGFVGGMLRLRRVVAMPWLTCFCYHRIADAAVAAADAGIVDATPAQFDHQLALLSEHFTFVGIDDVDAHLTARGRLPRNPALITFDDGYKECFTVAAPLLERRGARAAFFVPTTYIDDRRIFWWDRVALLLARSREPELSLDYPVPLRLRTTHAQARLLDVIKKTPRLDVERFLEQVERATGVTLDRAEERAIVDRSLMTWDDVRALSAAGMDIGSHTRTHRVLGTLDPSELDRELRGSRLELEERVDAKVRSIAYPVGYPITGSALLRDAVRDAGYRVGLSCRAGTMSTSSASTDPLDVPRILMDTRYSHQTFSALASLPALAPRTSVDIA